MGRKIHGCFLVPLIGGIGDIIITKIGNKKMVYTANWVIIYHLPPIKGTRNNKKSGSRERVREMEMIAKFFLGGVLR